MTLPRRAVWCAAALILGSSVVTIFAQGSESPSPGSLAAVAAEIRQLRLAVEESTRTQTQTEALGTYISAQQARLTHLAGKLETARRELDRVTAQSREVASELSNNEGEMQTANQEYRVHLQAARKILQQQAEKVAAQLYQAQVREMEADQLLQTEEARWTELVGRMEQLIKR